MLVPDNEEKKAVATNQNTVPSPVRDTPLLSADEVNKPVDSFIGGLTDMYGNNASPQAVPAPPKYKSFEDVVTDTWNNRPQSQVEKEQKQLKAKGVASAITDAFTNLSNLYFTSKGAPDMGGTQYSKQVSDQVQKQNDYLKRLQEERFKAISDAKVQDAASNNSWYRDMAKAGYQNSNARQNLLLGQVMDAQKLRLKQSFDVQMANATTNENRVKIAEKYQQDKELLKRRNEQEMKMAAIGHQNRLSEGRQSADLSLRNGETLSALNKGNKRSGTYRSITASDGRKYAVDKNLATTMAYNYLAQNSKKFGADDPLSRMAMTADLEGLDEKQMELVFSKMSADPNALRTIKEYDTISREGSKKELTAGWK